jgi:hypothetical protein
MQDRFVGNIDVPGEVLIQPQPRVVGVGTVPREAEELDGSLRRLGRVRVEGLHQRVRQLSLALLGHRHTAASGASSTPASR